MSLRRKIYKWYAATLIFIIMFLCYIHPPAENWTLLIIEILVVGFSVVSVILFAEYGIFLRVARITKGIKRVSNKRIAIRDYGYDEISEIITFINDSEDEKNTLRKQIESLQNQVRSTVEEAPLLIVKFSRVGKISYANKTYMDHLGIDPGKVGEVNLFEVLEDKGYDFSLERDLEALTRRTPSISKVYKRKSHLGWILWIHRANFDKFGNIEEYLSIGVDITEQKKVEEKLSYITGTISQIVLWVDSDLKCEYVSEGVEVVSIFASSKRGIGSDVLKKIRFRGFDMDKLVLDAIKSGEQQRFIGDIFNVVKGRFTKFSVEIRPAETGAMILLNDVSEEVESQIRLEKNNRMKKMTFDIISNLTSVDLKNVMGPMEGVPALLAEAMNASCVGLGIFEEESVAKISSCSSCGDTSFDEFKGPKTQFSSWWLKTFEDTGGAFKISDIESAATRKEAASVLGAENCIVAPVSFNHTVIGVIVAFSGEKDYAAWDDIDLSMAEMAGRLAGTILRPRISKTSAGIHLDELKK